jgi:hypothetical protein
MRRRAWGAAAAAHRLSSWHMLVRLSRNSSARGAYGMAAIAASRPEARNEDRLCASATFSTAAQITGCLR